MIDDKKDTKLYGGQLKRLKENRDEAEKKINILLPKNIDHLRKFHLQLITISLIVLAAVLPLLSSSNQVIFKTEILSYAGIVFIFISLILTIIYLTHILIKENKDLTNKRVFYSKSFGDEIAEIENYFKKKIPFKNYYYDYYKRVKNYEEEEKKLGNISKIVERVDVMGWILSISFLMGIFLIGLSFFNF